MPPFYLSMPPFYCQDFGSSLLSFLWTLFLIDTLFHLHLFGVVGFYHVPSSDACFAVLFCFFSISFIVFGASLLTAVRPQFLLILKSAPSGWVLTSPLWGSPGKRTDACVLLSGAGVCSSEMHHHIQWCVWVFMSLVWLWAACLLTGRFVLLFC